jgi:cation-transporting P-type ATPase C
MKVIDQNHYFAISTDLGGAALGMIGMLSPVMAGMIHIFHTAGILVNSSRLLSWDPSCRSTDNNVKNKMQQRGMNTNATTMYDKEEKPYEFCS